MDTAQAEALAAICVMAAFADGEKSAEERDHLKGVFDDLDGASHSAVYQRVLLKKTDVAKEAAALDSEELRRLAYEMAVCVCDADGVTTAREREWLSELARTLGVGAGVAEAVREEADGMAMLTLEEPGEEVPTLDPVETNGMELAATGVAAGAAGAAAVAGAQASQPAVEQAGAAAPTVADPAVLADIDRMVLKYAILNGALELLPQNLATLAVVPLQTKMVYRVGKKVGYSLDAGHVKEFIGVVGLGLTGQVVESFARDLFSDLAGKFLGKTAKKITKKATGPLMTFATTWALGAVAKQYYAGGRTLSAVDLRKLFSSEVNRGKQLFEQHRGQVESTSQNISPGDVMKLVRGGGPA